MKTPEIRASATVALLGGFACTVAGQPQTLPMGCQRLLAFLAVHDRAVPRSYVASNLWLDKDEARAGANLRSALWRLGQLDLPLVIADGQALHLHPAVELDVRRLVDEAYRLSGARSDGLLPDRALFDCDLLPGWYDEWLVLERERLHQLRLHALELLSGQLLLDGRLALAIDAACASIAGEPLRESAHRALIAAHLASGNRVEAVRQYERFRVTLRDAVGLEPTAEIRRLLDDALAPSPG